jgi:hypothetical protein
MRRLLVAALLILAVPTTSHALVGLGLRLGYGVPTGDLAKGSKYKDVIDSQVPLQLDVMFGPRSAQYGFYVGYAPNQVDTTGIPASVSVTSSTTRVGLQATRQLLDLGLVGIWAGAASGLEVYQMEIKGGTTVAKMQVRGWEFLTVTAGVDMKALPLLDLGAFVSAGFGQFGVATVSIGGVDSTQGIGADKRTHGLVQLGIRGMISL